MSVYWVNMPETEVGMCVDSRLEPEEYRGRSIHLRPLEKVRCVDGESKIWDVDISIRDTPECVCCFGLCGDLKGFWYMVNV